MCLILFSYAKHPHYKLVLASNRDEFYARPTLPLAKWSGKKTFWAGKDIQNNGSWMGITKDLRIAAITNYRDPSLIKKDAPSRGLLVRNYLESNQLPFDYLNEIKPTAVNYNGFNLIAGDRDELYYFSNVSGKIEKIVPGLHGLSNRFLDTPWPKVKNGKEKLAAILSQPKAIESDDIFALLNDKSIAPDQELPDTGVGLELERMLSAIFIKSENYGTRASSIILIDKDDRVTFIEKSYIKRGIDSFETKLTKFDW